MRECSLHRDASSPEEYQLVEGYAEGVQDVVQGYQAKVAGLGQSTKTRHPGGRGGGKRGGKVSCLALSCLMRTCRKFGAQCLLSWAKGCSASAARLHSSF